jgi:hypothetical protein
LQRQNPATQFFETQSSGTAQRTPGSSLSITPLTPGSVVSGLLHITKQLVLPLTRIFVRVELSGSAMIGCSHQVHELRYAEKSTSPVAPL